MQKNLFVWLIASYFVVTCLLSEALAANNPPRSPWLVKEAWMTDQPLELSANSHQLIRAIRNASVHGLNPDSYGLTEIMAMVDAMIETDEPLSLGGRPQKSVPARDYNLLSEFLSRQMDQAFVHLATHLGQGVVDARSTQQELFRDVPSVNTTHLLESVRERPAERHAGTRVGDTHTPGISTPDRSNAQSSDRACCRRCTSCHQHLHLRCQNR